MPTELKAALRGVLHEAASQDGLTAKKIRYKLEEKLGLPRDALLERKDEIMDLIGELMEPASEGPTSTDEPPVIPLKPGELLPCLKAAGDASETAVVPLLLQLETALSNRAAAEQVLPHVLPQAVAIRADH